MNIRKLIIVSQLVVFVRELHEFRELKAAKQLFCRRQSRLAGQNAGYNSCN
jgi:hypothetical protein